MAVIFDFHPVPKLVLLSGYDHPMYNDTLQHWYRDTKQVTAEAGKVLTEVPWINSVAKLNITEGQMTLF